MDFYRHLFTRKATGLPVSFALIYVFSVVFTFQTLLTAYSSSTYLEQFVTPKWVGLIFAISAAGALVLSLLLPRILRALGNVHTTLLLMILISLSLVCIGLGASPLITVIAFIIFLILNPQIYLNIDIFLETLTGTNEDTTGRTRGLILTVMSVAAFFAPLVMGYIIGAENNLTAVYNVGAVVGLICIALLISRFRHFYDPVYTTVRVRDMLTATLKNVNVRTVIATQFFLQFFYAWAIIYIPLYLAREVGFSWDVISTILASGLLAFILFEYPIGILADRKYGEKEMMALGFVILALASASISFMAGTGVLGWMLLMFLSRIGASLVEVTTESYFFKHVDGKEANLISLFRLTRPLANLIGALVGSLALLFLPFNLIFVVLALIMASGVFITSLLTDTK